MEMGIVLNKSNKTWEKKHFFRQIGTACICWFYQRLVIGLCGRSTNERNESTYYGIMPLSCIRRIYMEID